MTTAPQAGVAARLSETINTHVNKITKNDQKLIWVLIIDGFCRFFDNLEQKSAIKSRIHWIYSYIYNSISRVSKPFQPGAA